MTRVRPTGLTWIEVLIVVAILGTLMALLLPATQSARESAREAAALAEQAAGEDEAEEKQLSSPQRLSVSGADSARSRAINDANAKPVTGVSRRVIFEASIGLVVKDFDTAQQELKQLVQKHEGFLADATVKRRKRQQVSGSWRARIPVDRFNGFLDAVVRLGLPESQRQTAEDVTEEFVDLEARIRNKQQLEERIVELLGKSSGEIKDVIQIERELARVRGEIERMEGRLRYLTDRTELTTVSITMREDYNYVPPSAPIYSERVATAWGDSLTAVREFGENTSVSFVYAFPWLAIAGALLVPSGWLLHRSRKRAASESSE